VHVIAGDPDHGMHLRLTPGQASDCKVGRELIESFAFPTTVTHLVMDKGYSSYDIRDLCASKNIEAVVPPKGNYRCPWLYNRHLYAYRNEIERHFHRLKNYRRIATRYDKLMQTYSGFILLGMIMLVLKVIC
jgi:putative transposase